MGLFSTLKWLWDPRTESEKAYAAWDAATPLQTHTQYFVVWLTNTSMPFEVFVEFSDYHLSSFGNIRTDVEYQTQRLRDTWGSKGITLNGVFYPPARIEKVEIGRVEVTNKVDHD